MSERDDVLAANEAFYRAFANADTPGMEGIWAEDLDTLTVVHPGSTAISGRSDVLESWSTIFEGVSRVNIRYSDPSAYLHGDIAIV
ncbi:MAG: nuclear transport factor 2 family protein, partial [Alphaproteobacteria bacterium]